MVFNATFNNISAISWWSALLMAETEHPEKTTNLPQVTDKLYHHIMLYQVHLAWMGLYLLDKCVQYTKENNLLEFEIRRFQCKNKYAKRFTK